MSDTAILDLSPFKKHLRYVPMSDSARSKNQYPTRLVLPPRECPRWVRPQNGVGPLLYLSWGKRCFGKNPIAISKHEGWSQLVVLKGNPILQIADQSHSIQSGKMLLIPPEVPYGWTDANESNQTEQLTWIWNSSPTFLPNTRKKGVWYSTPLSSAGTKHIIQLHLESRKQIEIADRWTPEALEGIRKQIDVEWARSQTSTLPHTDVDFRFELAVRWMNQRMDETKPIQQLQDYLQVSSATLKRLFLLKTAKNPQQYFHELKFKKAKSLLQTKGTSVKSVAIAMGYRHVNDFTRAFQRHYQSPPSSFLS
jgi:AraC family transcriptional regulator of arabinose operon